MIGSKNQLCINLQNISKSYKLTTEKPTLVESIFSKQTNSYHTALDNLSLEVKTGEKVGIVGPNGAGKTTLLKTIIGISQPDTGSVQVSGKIVSLINLMAGFHPEMSGFENIKLNGLLLGMQEKEIESKRSKIIAFADIGKFIHSPLHTYSSGMKLRLGFSIAIHSDPDILILDEGISAGDEKFRNKANKRIQKLFHEDKTIVVVSHWLSFLKENCTRIIWMEDGAIKKDGSVKILSEYSSFYTNNK